MNISSKFSLIKDTNLVFKYRITRTFLYEKLNKLMRCQFEEGFDPLVPDIH